MKEPSLQIFHGAAESLALGCECVEYLQCASRKQITPHQLHNAIMQYLQHHKCTYADTIWVFKHHMACHFGQIFDQFGYLVDSLVGERKHRNPKRFAQGRKSRIGYEKGMMSDMVLQHFGDWLEWSRCSLEAPKHVPRALKTYVEELFPGVPVSEIQLGSRYVHASGARFHTQDVVMLSATVGAPFTLGEIWYHFRVGGEHHTCVSLWQFLRVSADGVYAFYSYSELPRLFLSSALRVVCIYRVIGDKRQVINPLQYRLNQNF